MKYIKNNFFIALLSLAGSLASAQNLDDLLKEEEKDKKPTLVSATFKGTRLINGHTIESPGKGVLQLMFSHRFGPLDDPLYTFGGMDRATIRIGLDYGITDRFAIGIGRSTIQKAIDAYAKFKLLRQSEGGMPISVSLLQTVAMNTERWPQDGLPRTQIHRYYYSSQVFIARKMSSWLSLQLMPTYIHRNLTFNTDQLNDIYALGLGFRSKISKRFAITGEYYLNLRNRLGAGYHDPLALGFEIETGGHVFQIHFTNSQGMIEHQFIGMTTDPLDGGFKGIRLGFNFSRVFQLVKQKSSSNAW